MWESLFPGFRPGLVSGDADLARAEAELGFALPETFKSLCRTLGAGRIGGQTGGQGGDQGGGHAGGLRVFTPVPVEAADLVMRADLIAHSVAAALAALAAAGAPHAFRVEDARAERTADPGLLERACFFAETEGGDFPFFDVTPGFPEYDVWVLGADLETVRFGGHDLAAFLRAVMSLEVLDVLGEDASPLAPVFLGDDADALARLGGDRGDAT